MTAAAMFWATVPETAINENSYARRTEHDVRLPAQTRQGRLMNAVAQTQPV
jgi:hypothetical protein